MIYLTGQRDALPFGFCPRLCQHPSQDSHLALKACNVSLEGRDRASARIPTGSGTGILASFAQTNIGDQFSHLEQCRVRLLHFFHLRDQLRVLGAQLGELAHSSLDTARLLLEELNLGDLTTQTCNARPHLWIRQTHSIRRSGPHGASNLHNFCVNITDR